jgi:hypothetical protein
MSSNEEIIQRIEHKKQLLLEQKCLYSQVTDELSAENQLHFRMSKALKQQNINIKRKTKKYIDNCVQRALFEAELEYSTEILKNITNPTEYVRKISHYLFMPFFATPHLSSSYLNRTRRWKK